RSGSPGMAAGTSSSTTEAHAGNRAMSDRSGHVKALLLAGGLGTRLRPAATEGTVSDAPPPCDPD
ncbi:MAG: hypothetical protein ACLP9L_14295, partial [Thermoguttaceae bacterium]